MMQARASLKIPKYTVNVEIRSHNGEERSVVVYVAEEMDADGRSERLQDIFSERRFVPVRTAERFELLSAQRVEWIKVDLISALDELDPQAEEGENACTAPVTVELDSGAELSGIVRYYMPFGMRRLGDYLEGAPRWIPLRTPDFVYLVNKERIARVIPVES